jgi:hypothetical protein
MIALMLSILPALLVIFLLIIGFCLGFTAYAIILQINVRKGRAFVIDRNGTWQPFDPRGLDKTMIRYGTVQLPGEDLKVFVDGQPVERWSEWTGKPWPTKK